ncbi:hypothetical protein L3X38_003316 [Prunus dulcis]|uniref:Reverse transcriptase domain-containing protein n=1 Tax=Prunus dulcis TaxID=3755 RepID=A0AAD4ZLV1_PRUDU|nr:hypothetical protein L3X38_003316 [Prunus dulcis]
MDMTGDIQEEMRSHQVEKLRKMRLDDNQRGPIDPTRDKAGFGIWNVVSTRKAWKKNFKNGTTASEDKGKGVSPEVVHKRQEKVFHSSNALPQKDKKEVVQKNLLSINGKAIQSKDDGGWNDLIPPNKGKKKVGRPRKVLSDISNKSSCRPAIVLRPSSKNLPHDSTITSVSELDQALSNLRRPVTSFDNGGLEIGEVNAHRNDYSSTSKPRARNIIYVVYRAANQDMKIQDLKDSKSVQLDSKVGEALIADVSAHCAEDGKAQGKKRSLLAMQDLKYRHKLDMLVILEPRISSNKAGKVISQLGFAKAKISDVVGFSGEKHLQQEFEDLLDQEDVFWKQKSRVSWLQAGDINFKFFHITILVRRRRRNRIERLKDNNGDWISRKEGLKALAVEYFHWLFLDDVVDIIRSPLPSLFPHTPEADLAAINKEVTEKEVQDALFAIGPYKTPGPDGYSAIFFFHNCWSLSKKDIEVFVFKCFSTGSVLEFLNSTLVTLVPKITNPQSTLQFRPISLCNTLYKVVSKIIVGRLRPLMCKLVSPNRVSFVPGRQISDNIFIAQEVLHRFHRARGKTGHIIAVRVLKNKWKAVKQAMVMKNSLEEFCELSGQQVNFEKSLLYISANTKSDLVDQIELICGATRSADMGNYLGVPLSKGGLPRLRIRGFWLKFRLNFLLGKVNCFLWLEKSL